MNEPRRCEVRGCGRKVEARGKCSPHYRQWLREVPADERDLPDPVAVERACAGYPTTLTRPELREAICTLVGKGFSYGQAAGRLGVTKRTVERHQQQSSRKSAPTVSGRTHRGRERRVG